MLTGAEVGRAMLPQLHELALVMGELTELTEGLTENQEVNVIPIHPPSHTTRVREAKLLRYMSARSVRTLLQNSPKQSFD